MQNTWFAVGWMPWLGAFVSCVASNDLKYCGQRFVMEVMQSCSPTLGGLTRPTFRNKRWRFYPRFFNKGILKPLVT